MSDQPTFDTPLQPATDESNPSSLESAGSPEAASLANAGRDASGVPPVVGLGDGKITSDGKFVPQLSDEDNERLRAIVQQQQPIVRLPDGSIRITFTLRPELAIPLEAWAEGAGVPFDVYAQDHLETALTATILGANVG
jgi:hypothetical protein